MNGVTQVPHAINSFYSRTMLERGLPLLVHSLFAQVKDIPVNNTNAIRFRRYGALATNTTPLADGVTPLGKTLSTTNVDATVSQYGDYVILTDWVKLTTVDPLLQETAEVLGEQAMQSLDIIVRDILNAGSTIQYAGAVAGRVNIATSNKISKAEVKKAVKTLKNANASRITTMVSPDSGYNTTPIDASFVAIVHPNTTFDLQDITEFVPVEKYANKAKLLPGEVGKLMEVRFIETTYAKVFTGEGDGGIDVYSTMIMGKNAYGTSRISGHALKNIIKGLGSAGTEDPLDQRASSGWKATLVAVRLNETFMLRLEHAVT